MFVVPASIPTTGGYVPAGAIWLDGTSNYLQWTPSVAGNRERWVISFWTKLVEQGNNNTVFFEAQSNIYPYNMVSSLTWQRSGHANAATLDSFGMITTPTTDYDVRTNARFRDTSAWYHIVVSHNYATNEHDIYVNGVQQTYLYTDLTMSGGSGGSWVNAAVPHSWGYDIGTPSYNPFYLAEVIQLDGSSIQNGDVDITDFGEFDANGNWVPIDPSGLTFGTNGYWLNFADSADLGKDASGVTTENIINAGFGAIISDLTSSESSIFDGSTSSGYAQKSSATSVYAGKNWGTGVTRSITKVRIYGKSGFDNSNFIDSYSSTVNYKLEGSTTGAWSGEEVTLGSTSFTDDDASAYQELTPGITTAYQYHRVVLDGFTSNTVTWGEIQFFSQGNDFTPISMSPANSTSDRPADDAANDLGNYATLSPINKDSNITLSLGNTKAENDASAAWNDVLGTIGVSSGRWYWEMQHVFSGNGWDSFGIIGDGGGFNTLSNRGGAGAFVFDYSGTAFRKYNESTSSATYWTGSHTTGDVIGFDLDADNQTLELIIGGTARGTVDISGIAAPYFPFSQIYQGGSVDHIYNFGQSAFSNTPPSGAKAISTANLPAPAVTVGTNGFEVIEYTGNSTGSTNITGTDWGGDGQIAVIKNLSQADEWKVVDSVRGATKKLNFDTDAAESTEANGVTAFIDSGVTLGTGANGYNDSGETFILMRWRINATYGIAVNASVSHTNGGSTNVAHGMAKKPKMVWAKRTDSTGTWYVFVEGTMTNDTDYWTSLDGILPEQNLANTWGAHTTTNTVLGSGLPTGTYVVYSFAEIEGFSRFDGYAGNSSTDGPLNYLGFIPAIVTIHNLTKAGSNRYLWTGQRNPYNVWDNLLLTDAAVAETTGASAQIDALSNAFKLRQAAGDINTSAQNHAFWAFAEYPFGGEGVSQARAR
jgi:hypothetical protein